MRIFKERMVTVVITFIVFGLFPLVLFRMLAFPRASSELKQGVQRNLEGILNKQKDMISLLCDEKKSHARSVSDTIQSALLIHGKEDFVSLFNGKDKHEYLRLKTQLECTKADYGYKGIFVCDGAGIIQTATENEKPLVGMNIMKEKSFRNIQKTLYDGETYISDVTHFSLESDFVNGNEAGAGSMFMSYPIKNESHDVVGAIVLWMDTSILNKAMKSVILGKTGEAYLVNRDGVMITQSRFSDRMRNPKVINPDTQALTKSVEQCVTARTNGYDLDGYKDYDGLKVVGAWSWVKDLNMGLIVEIDADEALGAVDNINSMVKSLMFVIVIPAFVIAVLLYRKFNSGSMFGNLTLPRKALLGVTGILVVGFVMAILDGYELRKERGYLREQKYTVHNPFNVFGSIITQRDDDFIKSNISKFKQTLPVFKSENTSEEKDEIGLVKSDIQPSLEKTVATWELKP